MKILLVDRNEKDRQELARRLRESGHEVQHEASEGNRRKWVSLDPFDIILSHEGTGNPLAPTFAQAYVKQYAAAIVILFTGTRSDDLLFEPSNPGAPPQMIVHTSRHLVMQNAPAFITAIDESVDWDILL